MRMYTRKKCPSRRLLRLLSGDVCYRPFLSYGGDPNQNCGGTDRELNSGCEVGLSCYIMNL